MLTLLEGIVLDGEASEVDPCDELDPCTEFDPCVDHCDAELDCAVMDVDNCQLV